jgi:thioesterase domain-containing protein
MVRQKKGISLSLQDIFKNQTIEKQTALLVTLMAENGTAPADIDKTGQMSKEAAETEHVLQLHTGVAGKYVFLLPGAGGFCDSYRSLAECLGNHCTVYGIQMMGIGRGEQPFNSIQEIAAQNIKWIKQVQPEGPYTFMGHSFGGIVAYEMIRQLEENGDIVQAGVILDSPAVLQSSIDEAATLINSVKYFLHDYKVIQKPYPGWITDDLALALAAREKKDMVSFCIDYIKTRIPADGSKHDLVIRAMELLLRNRSMNYLPERKVNAQLLVVRAMEMEEYWNKWNYSLGWEGYGTTVKTILTPGGHLSMITEKNYMQELVVRLRNTGLLL